MGEGGGQSLESRMGPQRQRRWHIRPGTSRRHLPGATPKSRASFQPCFTFPPCPLLRSRAHCRRGACAVPRRGAGCVPTARAIMPGVFAGYRGCSVNGRRACHSRYLAPRRSKSRRRIRDKTLQVFPCTLPPSCRAAPNPAPARGSLARQHWQEVVRKHPGAADSPPGTETDTAVQDQGRRWERSCQMGLGPPPKWGGGHTHTTSSRTAGPIPASW